MNKMFKFLVEGKEIFVIASTELQARERAKLAPAAVLASTETLNEDW